VRNTNEYSLPEKYQKTLLVFAALSCPCRSTEKCLSSLRELNKLCSAQNQVESLPNGDYGTVKDYDRLKISNQS